MRRATALALLLLPAACGPQQTAERGLPAAAAPSLSPIAMQAARLPESLANFARGSTAWHEPARPGLGVSVDYAAPARAAAATVSLYDRGEGAVSDNPGNARLAREFEAAVAEALHQAGTRTSQQLAERGRSALAVPGGAPLSCATLEGSYGRQPFRTLVCLGAAGGRFIKVQLTAPLRPVVPVEAEPFVVGIAQAARGA